jgi:hypothetical protein
MHARKEVPKDNLAAAERPTAVDENNGEGELVHPLSLNFSECRLETHTKTEVPKGNLPATKPTDAGDTNGPLGGLRSPSPIPGGDSEPEAGPVEEEGSGPKGVRGEFQSFSVIHVILIKCSGRRTTTAVREGRYGESKFGRLSR